MFWTCKGASHTRLQTFSLLPAGGELSARHAEIESRRLFFSYRPVYTFTSSFTFGMIKRPHVLGVFSATVEPSRRFPTSHCCENNNVELSLMQMNDDGECATWQPVSLLWRAEQEMYARARPIMAPHPQNNKKKKDAKLKQALDLSIFFHTIFNVIDLGYLNFSKYQNAEQQCSLTAAPWAGRAH